MSKKFELEVGTISDREFNMKYGDLDLSDLGITRIQFDVDVDHLATVELDLIMMNEKKITFGDANLVINDIQMTDEIEKALLTYLLNKHEREEPDIIDTTTMNNQKLRTKMPNMKEKGNE